MASNVINIGTPSVGGIRAGTNNAAQRTANLLNRLSGQFSALGKEDVIKRDEQQRRSAEADIVKGMIDPARMDNEMVYSATVTRNTVHAEADAIMQQINDPQSDIANMPPDEFRKFINQKAQDFYKGNKGKYAATNAAVFNRYMAANQTKFEAAQAAQYRTILKQKQQDNAITALSKVPLTVDGDAFNLNMSELTQMSLPEGMFSAQERRAIVLMAAANQARQGDRRLLDWAKGTLNVDDLEPDGVAAVEGFYRKANDRREQDLWNVTYKGYEEKAQSGMFTKTDWDDLIVNQDALDKLGGRGQIDSWLAESGRARQNSAMLEDYYTNFTRGIPIVGASADQIDQVIDRVLADGADAGQPAMQVMDMVARGLAAQNVESASLKDTLNSALGRQVWSSAIADDEQFQTAFTTAKILSDNMSNDQLKRQMGESAFEAFGFIDNEMRFNGGDFRAAVQSFSQATQARKKNGLESRLSTAEYNAVKDGVQAIFAGDIETSDPNMTKFFGMSSKAGNALVTGPVRADVEAAAKRLVMKGWSPEAAVQHAVKTVAANYSEFGGEMHYTGGVGVGTLFGFASGTPSKELERAWDFYAEQLGKDPKQLSPMLSGGMVTIIDRETGDELPPVPAGIIGEMWEAKKLQDQSDRMAADEEDKLAGEQVTADMFHQMLYNRYGRQHPQVVFTTLPDGEEVSIMDYEKADLETKMLYYESWRRDFNKGTQRFAKVLVTAGDFWSNAISTGMDWFRDKLDNVDVVLPGDIPVDSEYISTPEQVAAAEERAQADAKSAPHVPEEDDIPAAPMTQDAKKPTKITRIAAQIMKHEGFVGKPYKDSVGVTTVGYGRNLEANPITEEEWDSLGGKRDLNKKPLTKDEAQVLFQNDLNRAQNVANTLFRNVWGNLNDSRCGVLVDMAFNLGPKRLAGFEKLYKALSKKDFKKAAEEMKNSEWYKQVGRRGKALVKMMRDGS
jgi:lysozyme